MTSTEDLLWKNFSLSNKTARNIGGYLNWESNELPSWRFFKFSKKKKFESKKFKIITRKEILFEELLIKRRPPISLWRLQSQSIY